MLPVIAALALGTAWLGYSRAAAAKANGGTLPTGTLTGVPQIDEIFVTARKDPKATTLGLPADADIIARTIWAEARGEGYAGMQAVANVIVNRLRVSQRTAARDWWGETIQEICLAPGQFSAWTVGDPNREKAMMVTPADLQFRTAQEIGVKAVAGILPDITGGARNYHALSVKPKWSIGKVASAQHGAHLFYNNIA